MGRRTFLFSIAGLMLGTPLLSASGGQTYTVQRGDTLTRIAARYNVTVRDLQRENNLRGSLILVGQRLRIPAAAGILGEVRSVTGSIRFNRRKWKYIVGHHSATAQGSAASFDQVSRRKGMKNGLAYHFVIGNGRGTPDGKIEIGSRWRQQIHGGHVSRWEFNNHGIGICLVGNFENTRPTPKQMESFRALVTYLGGEMLNNSYQFFVHREINPTLCPGRLFPTAQMHQLFG